MKKILYFLPLFLLGAEVQQVNYEGLIHISKVTANSIANITNRDVSVEEIDKVIKKFYETGYFQTISADYNETSKVLTFKFVEKPTIVQIERMNFSEELKKALKDNNLEIKKGSLYNQEAIDKLKQFISSYYSAKGYFNTYLEVDTKLITPTKMKLSLIIHKGRNLEIRDLKFYGSRHSDELEDIVDNHPATLWSILPFTYKGDLNLFKLVNDRKKILDYYLNRGYLDVQVSNPLAKTNFDNYIADISYKIDEGNRYIVKKVEVDYPKELKPKLPELKLKADKYFNIAAFRKDMEEIKHSFQNLGYAYAQVIPQVKKEGKFAYVTYKVVPGNIVYIRKVLIEGNAKTLDRVIRRNVYLAPNYKFSYQDLIDTENALKRTGYLEDVKVIQKRVSDSQMDIIVKVKEGLSGSLKAGISYGSYTKLGFDLAITERNVFGSGQSLTAKVNYTSVSSTYLLSLVNPRVFDSEYSSNFKIYKSSFDGISYTSNSKGFEIGVGKKLSRYVNANITYGYKTTHLSDVAVDNYLKDSTKSYIAPSISFNNTDEYFFPTTGTQASLNLEYAGIGGDEKYTSITGSYKYFYPITNRIYETVAVLKYRVIAGVIFKNGYLPLNEKFYLGGLGTVRGYSWYTISPRDEKGNRIGGKYKFITGPEISTPLSIKNRVWLSGFLDYGAVGEDSLDIKRASYGVSLDWVTPMGPLSFTWGWAINPKPEDDTQHFDFNIGTSF